MAEDKNPFIGIGASLVALFIPIVALIVIFVKDQAIILAPIAIAFAVMGIFLGYFAAKTKKK